MPAVRVESIEHWHRLRAEHVGSSEVGGLFGESSFCTPFELWQYKAGRLPPPDLSDDERVMWGTVMEPAIAEGVRRKTGWRVRKVHRYHTCRPALRLGASLDYEIICNPRGHGPGVLEIKTADWLVAKRWGDGPPLGYELQLQHALAAVGWHWGVIAVLVGGNDLRLYEYERRAKTIDLIRERVAAFWQSIDENRPPAPDYRADGDTIAALYRDATPGKVVATGRCRPPPSPRCRIARSARTTSARSSAAAPPTAGCTSPGATASSPGDRHEAASPRPVQRHRRVLARLGTNRRVQDRGVLRNRSILPARAGEALAGGSCLR
jgi:putative phage-type endonuclease